MSKSNADVPILNLTHFTIDDEGDLCIKLKLGPICEIKKISDYTIPSFIKDVRNASHGITLDKKLAEWLLDRDPTVFDKKKALIVAIE